MFLDAPPAIHQNTNSETIIVTSSYGRSKDKINQSVEIVSRNEALIASMAGGIGETLSAKPGISSTFYGPNASRPIIRGLGEDRIRMLVNGVQGVDASTISPDHAVAIDGLEAQSIEVLKGASALRYGGNAIGGIVNINDGQFQSVLPKEKLTGDVFLGFGSVDDSNAQALKLKAVSGNLLFQINGSRRESNDYRIPGYVQSGALRAITGDETKGRVPSTYGDIKNYGASVNYIARDWHVGIGAHKEDNLYGIPNEEAHIELDQKRWDFNGAHNLGGFFKEITFNGTSGKYSHAEVENTGEIGTVFNVKGHEARIEIRQAKTGNFDGMAGFQFAKRDFEAIGDEAFILPVTNKNHGVFFVELYENAKWGAEFGARIDNVEYSGLAGARKFDAQNYSATGFIKPFDGFKIALIASSSERIPTETELFANGPHAATQSVEIGDPNLKIEGAKSIELGLKYKKSKFDIDANIWQISFDNFISFANTGDLDGDLPIYQAIQKDATLKGYEARIAYHIGEFKNHDFDLDLGLDKVEGKFKDDTYIPRIPPMAARLGFDIQGENHKLRLELEHIGAQKKLAEFETASKSANVVNLEMTFRPQSVKNLEIIFAAQNITDQEVREHTSVLQDYLPRPGRNFKLALHYKL
ncbi:MAG: TonB-dependent receptor [Proteobacteria bacterium]|nr:TonB-dependent receptor [Pseudomonadota bacterium]